MTADESPEARLRRVVSRSLPSDQEREEALGRLWRLDALLREWSDRLGLTSFADEDERLSRYFAEALAAGPYLPSTGEVMDIGSGGGSPALPLAVLSPQLRWTLFESRRKKAWFLEEAARALGLDNVSVEARRFEGTALGPWTAITCRGVRLGARRMRDVARRVRPGGRFLWFSAERRLAEAVQGGETRIWAGVEGPLQLLPDRAAGGALLICRRGSD